MPLYNKAFDTIDESDLDTLIASQDSEAKTIEYKEKLPNFSVPPPGRNEVLKEFLADVSSFANAAGGDLLYGVKAMEGVPTEIVGLQLTNVDGVILSLEELIRTHIRPRFPFGIRPVILRNASKGVVLIVRIRRGFTPPHQITLDRDYRFYSRNSAGKYRLDVDELRNIFELSATTAERIRSFRAGRLSNVIAGETPVSLVEGAKVVLHLIPYQAFDPASNFDVSILREHSNVSNIEPFPAPSWGHFYNFDGLYTSSRENRSIGYLSYVQIFRNGIIEAVDGDVLRHSSGADAKFIPLIYEKRILEGLDRYMAAQRTLGVEPPVFVSISLLGVRGYIMAVSESRFDENRPIDRNNFIVPEVMIDNFQADMARLMRPAFDAIWNAAGWPGSPNYV